MAFKNFANFNAILVGLQKQLDVNSIMSRVINRVSNLITRSMGIPGSYTSKYNAVQLLQYDADGNLKDVTPAEQLSIPQSVINQAFADIQSAQALLEADVATMDKLPIEYHPDFTLEPTTPAAIKENEFTYIGSSHLGMMVKYGDKRIRYKSSNQQYFQWELEPDQVIVKVGSYTGQLEAIDWVGSDYTVIRVYLNSLGGVTVLVRKESEDFVPPDEMTTNFAQVGVAYISSYGSTGMELAGQPVSLRLSSADSVGFQPNSSSGILTEATKRLLFLYGNSSEGLGTIATVGFKSESRVSIASLLYPKDQIEALKQSLT